MACGRAQLVECFLKYRRRRRMPLVEEKNRRLEVTAGRGSLCVSESS